MLTRSCVLSALLVVMLSPLALACASRLGVDVAGVDNFGAVTAGAHGLYRGAQPSAEGIQTLRAMGVRTIINLRDDADPREQAWAAAAGMQYVRIPSSCHRPDAGDVQAFLTVMQGRPAPPLTTQPVAFPVFVHCRAGRDRTGLFVASYRIVEQHWSNQQAAQEMDGYGHIHIFCAQVDPFVEQLDPRAYDAGSD